MTVPHPDRPRPLKLCHLETHGRKPRRQSPGRGSIRLRLKTASCGALCDRSVPLAVFSGSEFFLSTCDDRTRISWSFSSHLHMRSSFTPLPSVCGSPTRAPASKTRRDGADPAAVSRYRALSGDRINRFGYLPERPCRTPDSGAPGWLKYRITTIIDGVFGPARRSLLVAPNLHGRENENHGQDRKQYCAWKNSE